VEQSWSHPPKSQEGQVSLLLKRSALQHFKKGSFGGVVGVFGGAGGGGAGVAAALGQTPDRHSASRRRHTRQLQQPSDPQKVTQTHSFGAHSLPARDIYLDAFFIYTRTSICAISPRSSPIVKWRNLLFRPPNQLAVLQPRQRFFSVVSKQIGSEKCILAQLKSGLT